MKNDCKHFQELLALQAMGDLNEQEAAELDRHLATCAPCRRDQVNFLRTVELLGPPPDFQLSELDAARMEVGFYKRLTRMEGQRESRKWNSRIIRFAAVIALVALGFAGGKLMSSSPGEERQTVAEYSTDQDRVAQVAQLKEVPTERPGLRLTPEGLQLIARGRNAMRP